MSLIKIDVNSGSIVSESAKAEAYRVGRVSGQVRLIVDSSHKSAVGTCIGNARKAKKLAVKALTDKIKANGLAVKIKSEENPTRKEKLRTQANVLKTNATANAKAAKELLRAGAAALRAAGLSALSSPLSATDISLTTEPGRSLKKVNAAQVDQLKVKGQKGFLKPGFAKLVADDFAQAMQRSKTPRPESRGETMAASYPSNVKVDKKFPDRYHTMFAPLASAAKTGKITAKANKIEYKGKGVTATLVPDGDKGWKLTHGSSKSGKVAVRGTLSVLTKRLATAVKTLESGRPTVGNYLKAFDKLRPTKTAK